MQTSEPTISDERYTSLLAACEEALTAGSTVDEFDVPADVAQDLERDLACVGLLREVLPTCGGALDAAAGQTTAELPERRLGHFEICRELGRGSFGIVYLAFDTRLGREVALKIPRIHSLVDPEQRKRFQREARAAAGLNHPNLVTVYEADQIGPICFIASEYCPGISLAKWLKQTDQPVPFRFAADLIARLADAMDCAHQHGVVHRDLKPANVLLVNGGVVSGGGVTAHDSSLTTHQPKITDFGLARFLQTEADATQTGTGATLGTPSYMAPEQAAGKSKQVGPAADIYALGAMLYELLTGRPPFQADSVFDALLMVRTDEPLSPSRLRPKLPRDLEIICLKCLEKEPQKRFASARELAADLRRFLAGEPIRARPVPAWERGLKWARRRPAVAAQAAVVVLLLGLFLWTALEGSRYLRAVELVRRLESVDLASVPKIVGDLANCRKWADPRLRKMLKDGVAEQQLHASLALLPVDPEQVENVYERMLEPNRKPAEFWILCQALRAHREDVAERLITFLNEEPNPDQRLRAAFALTAFDPRNSLWNADSELCDEVANKLLKENPADAMIWLQGTEALSLSARPVRYQIGDALLSIVSSPTRSETERNRAAHLRFICMPTEGKTAEMAAVIFDADDLVLYNQVRPYFLARGDEAVKLMNEELDKRSSPKMTELDQDKLAKRQANAAVLLLQYEQQEGAWLVPRADRLWPLLRDGAEPRLRSYLIDRFSKAEANPETLICQYEVEKDVGAREALLMSLRGFTLPAGQRQRLVGQLKLLQTYRDDPNPGIQAAVSGLLQSWKLRAELDRIDRQSPPPKR